MKLYNLRPVHIKDNNNNTYKESTLSLNHINFRNIFQLMNKNSQILRGLRPQNETAVCVIKVAVDANVVICIALSTNEP